MNIGRSAVRRFYTGSGLVSGTAKPIVAAGFAPETLFRGIRVRAAQANGAAKFVYVGPSTAQTGTGFKLEAGAEVSIEINSPSQVYVISNDVDAEYSWIAF